MLVFARLLVRHGEKHEGHVAARVPVRLDRGDLLRLMFQRVVPVLSPTKIWTGVRTAAIPTPLLRVVRARGRNGGP